MATPTSSETPRGTPADFARHGLLKAVQLLQGQARAVAAGHDTAHWDEALSRLPEDDLTKAEAILARHGGNYDRAKLMLKDRQIHEESLQRNAANRPAIEATKALVLRADEARTPEQVDAVQKDLDRQQPEAETSYPVKTAHERASLHLERRRRELKRNELERLRRAQTRLRRAPVPRLAQPVASAMVVRAPRQQRRSGATRAAATADDGPSGDSDPPPDAATPAAPPTPAAVVPTLLSPADLSARWSIPPDTIRTWARTGKLPAIKVGDLVRFDAATITAWLAGQPSAATAPPSRRRGRGLRTVEVRRA